jgi:hypothetical protein
MSARRADVARRASGTSGTSDATAALSKKTPATLIALAEEPKRRAGGASARSAEPICSQKNGG